MPYAIPKKVFTELYHGELRTYVLDEDIYSAMKSLGCLQAPVQTVLTNYSSILKVLALSFFL